MKKRINVQFMIITAIAIIGTICLLTIGFYEIFKIEVFEELKTTGYFLGSTNLFSDPERIDFVSQNDKIRVTLIDENGKILFDNKADISSMDNHINRREIQDAMNKGEASIIRKSNTRNSNTFYYAKRLDNGCILRVGKESRNIKSIIDIVIPAIMVFVLILIVIIVVMF